jgi:EamA domain-containing membrane protein RarD
MTNNENDSKKIKADEDRKTVLTFFGIGFIAICVLIIAFGGSRGLLFKSNGLEAYIKAIYGIILSVYILKKSSQPKTGITFSAGTLALVLCVVYEFGEVFARMARIMIYKVFGV